MDRASDYGSAGWGFESLRARSGPPRCDPPVGVLHFRKHSCGSAFSISADHCGDSRDRWDSELRRVTRLAASRPTTTTQQNPSGFRQLDLGYSPSRNAITGSGEHTSVLVPIYNDRIPQIINIHTGKIASLSNPDGDGEYRTVEVTPEGYVVYENIDSYGMLFDSDAALQSTFKTARNLPIVSHDETPRSAPDVKEFLTHQNAPWAVATLRMTGRHQDECMFEVTFTADGSTHTSPVPDALTPSLPSTCYFDPKQVSISADGSALYMDAFVGADKNKYVIDTVNGEAYTSSALNVSEQLTWVYDDMLIAVSKAGVKAFVPASS